MIFTMLVLAVTLAGCTKETAERPTEQPVEDVYKRQDYIRYILTGVFATEVSDASGMQLLDVPNRCWSDEVLEKLNIDKALLGKVYESCEVTGTILPDIADKTGLSTETKVVGGAGDNAAAAVGTGVVKDGTAFTTIGTSGVVFAHSSQVTIDPKAVSYTHLDVYKRQIWMR